MKRQRRRDIVLFMLPTVLIITVFLYFPVILNFVNSLFQWSAFSTQRRFVGAANYIKMFGDEVFRTAIFNNLVFMAVSVVFQIGLSLVMAAALEEKFMRRFQPFFRTVYFLPSLLMVTVTGIMFQIIYNPLIGLVNPLLELLGLDASGVDLLGSASSAIWAVVAVSQWQYIGYTLILFLVAMQNIPAQLYEAAELDGVGPVRKFFSITLPQIREMLMVNMIVTMTGSIKVFDEVWVMTGGGPDNSTTMIGLLIYKNAFEYSKFHRNPGFHAVPGGLSQ